MNFKGDDLGITVILPFLKICLIKFLLIPLYFVRPGNSEPLNDGSGTLTLVGLAGRLLLVALNHITSFLVGAFPNIWKCDP